MATTASNDYAIIKVLYNLAKFEGDMNLAAGASIEDINALDTNDPAVGAAENIYIVGHGYPGGMWLAGHDQETSDADEISDYIAAVVPNAWTGQVRVLTCRSAVAESEGAATWVDRLKEGLVNYGIDDVVGASGYSYGTPDTSTTGMTSVLDSKYEDFYNGGYSRGMDAVFKNKKKVPSTETRKKSKKHVDTPEKAAREWVRVRDELEKSLKELVGLASKDGVRTIPETITLLNTTYKKEWEALMADQLAEFTHYGLFA